MLVEKTIIPSYSSDARSKLSRNALIQERQLEALIAFFFSLHFDLKLLLSQRHTELEILINNLHAPHL